MSENRKSPLSGACSKCSARWGGINTCHCAGCYRTFSGIGAFDAHRVSFTCREPGALRKKKDDSEVLVQRERAGYSVWGFPEQEEAIEFGAA